VTTSAEPLLLDTSAALALVLADHEQHAVVVAAVRGLGLGLCGHAAFEVFSVLTRLPAASRLGRADAARVIASFTHTRLLGTRAAARLLRDLPALGIAGGAVYDALVGAAAVEHELELLSLDRRAAATYRELGVRVRVL